MSWQQRQLGEHEAGVFEQELEDHEEELWQPYQNQSAVVMEVSCCSREEAQRALASEGGDVVAAINSIIASREMGHRASVEPNENDDSMPTEFLCPITQSVMLDPVLCADGHSYEREAIERWLRRRATSPLTNSRLRDTRLVPNHTLRSLIEGGDVVHAEAHEELRKAHEELRKAHEELANALRAKEAECQQAASRAKELEDALVARLPSTSAGDLFRGLLLSPPWQQPSHEPDPQEQHEHQQSREHANVRLEQLAAQELLLNEKHEELAQHLHFLHEGHEDMWQASSPHHRGAAEEEEEEEEDTIDAGTLEPGWNWGTLTYSPNSTSATQDLGTTSLCLAASILAKGGEREERELADMMGLMTQTDAELAAMLQVS